MKLSLKPGSPKRVLGLLTVALFASGALVSILPSAQAANGDWTLEHVDSLTDTVTQTSMAHNGEVVAMAYKYRGSGSDGLIGFSVRDSTTGAWTEQNGDLSSGVHPTDQVNVQLIYVSGSGGATVWVVSATDQTAFSTKIYRSTNNGVAWSTIVSEVDCGGNRANLVRISATILALNCGHVLHKSADGGATWGSGVNFMDNAGTTGETATQTLDGSNAVFYWTGTTLQAIWQWANANGDGYATTNSGMSIWSVSYGGPCPTDLGGTRCDFVTAAGCGIACYTPAGNWRISGTGTPIYVADYQAYSFRSYVPTTGNPLGFQSSVTNDKIGVASGTPEDIKTAGCTALGTHTNGYNDAVSGNAGNLYVAPFMCTTGTGFTGLNINIKSGVAGSWTQSYNNPAITSSGVVDVDQTPSKSFVFYNNGALGNIGEILWATNPTSTTPTPSATASVTALVGFDVDPTGGTVIARYDGGGTVGVFSGQALGAPVQEVETDCNRDSGVTAFTLDVAYVTCDPDDNSADFLRIRTNELEHITTVPLGQCDTNHPIHDGEDDYSLNPDPEAFVNEIRSFQLLSIDFTQAQGSSTDGIAGTGTGAIKYCRLQAAFGASFETGKVGVLTADAARCISDDCRVNMDANRRIASAWSQYDPASNPISHMCAVIPITIPGQTSAAAIMAVDDSGTTKIYSWNRDTYTPGVALAESAAGIFSQGRGVGCGKGDRVLVSTDTKLAAFNVTSQLPAWTPITLPAVPPQRGTAMSYDGKWGVQVTSGSLCPSTDEFGCAMMVNMTSGTSDCTYPLPDGVFHEIRLTDHAVNLFIATSSEIDRWDVTSCTDAPSGEGGFDDGCGPTAPMECPGTGDGGDGGGGSGDGCGAIICPPTGGVGGLSSSALTLFLGIVIVAAFAASMHEKTGTGAAGLAIFAVLGLFIGYALGYIHLWVIVALASIGIGAAFLGFKNGGNSTGM